MSPKRSLTPEEGAGTPSKRLRLTQSPSSAAAQTTADIGSRERPHEDDDSSGRAVESFLVTQHSFARSGIKRSIALALQHDGFDSATPQALESFTAMVEEYLDSLIQNTLSISFASRRERPVAPDFQAALRRHNVSISSLKPHLRNPISLAQLAPTYANAGLQDQDAFATLPLLSEELSGQPDKDAKEYIPTSYPGFPSRHTYSFSKPEDGTARDSKKTREEAARTAQHGEDALRRLVRASKTRKQKEAKSLVERDDHGRERFRLWEATMKRFMGADHRGEHTNTLEMADHSMIVNGDGAFWRKEVMKQKRFGGSAKTKG